MNRIDRHKIQKKADSHQANELMAMLNHAKREWLDVWFQRLMPPDVYALAKTHSGSHRKALRRWMVDNEIRLHDLPDVIRLTRGKQVLGDFTVQIEGSKVNFLCRDYLTAAKEPPTNDQSAEIP